MVIAFDTFFLAKKFRNVGIYEYSKNLLFGLQRIAHEDATTVIRYFVSQGYSEDIVTEKLLSRGTAIRTNLLRFDRLWRLGLINAAALRAGADMIFSTSPNILPLGVLPVAVTIHDAISQKLPADLVEGSAGLRLITRMAAKLSRKIITDSQCSKNDLIESYNLPSQKVSVVYLGYDGNIFNAAKADPVAQEAVFAKFGIRRPYIFHHGMVQLRKNLGRLIQAYGYMQDRRKDLDPQLVLAGPSGFGSEEIKQMASRTVFQEKVIFTGPLPELDLALLIKGATLCVIPSLYEGFCLPMVEAMACGIPTIASNSSCLPEVSGRLLRYFDPLSIDDIADTLEKVLGSENIRIELAQAGVKRASEFSWERCARETLQALTGTETANGTVLATSS